MVRIVLINVDMHGHINPTLAFTHELVRTGNQVFYYASQEFKTSVEATGAYFRSCELMFGKSIGSASTKVATLLSQVPILWIEECQKILPHLLTSVNSDAPEVIVYDIWSLVGRLIADILRVPAIKFCPTYASNEHFNLYYKLFFQEGAYEDKTSLAAFDTGIKQLSIQFSFQPFQFNHWITHVERLNIIFIPRSFQPMSETFDSRFEFVGPCIQKQHITSDFSLEQQSDPLLYISLGTVFNQWSEFFHMCVIAFGEKPWRVVMACGHSFKLEALGSLPNNFIVQQHIPQLTVLEQADVFISHGGMNSTMESLFFGVPLVVIPQAVDQEVTASHLHKLGLGIHLPKQKVNVGSLVEAVERTLNDLQIKKQVAVMQSMVKASGGYKRVAEVIQNFGIAESKYDFAPVRESEVDRSIF
ncbi:MAG: glycosyltransferase [Rhizonema sp. PD37]|nr:glycosyltransferase [Rhizonema sp. PD37]